MLIRLLPIVLAPLSWLAFATILLLFGVNILRFTAGDLLNVSNPQLALMFDGGQSAARVALAKGLALEDASRLDAAVSEARQALKPTPLTPGALSLLARAAQDKGLDGQASDLMQRANRLNLRDVESGVWLLSRNIQRGDVEAALRLFDILLRGQSSATANALMSAVSPALTSAPYRAAFVTLLRGNPGWRSLVLGSLSTTSSDFDGLNDLFATLQGGKNPPTAAEIRPFLARLVAAGLLDQAYSAWIKSLPPDRLNKSVFLYNARFEYPPSNVPFDWIFTPVEQAFIEVKTENDRRILKVDFFGGRVRFANVSHLLLLPTGSYRFSGQERSENLQNDRGLWWRIFCVANPTEALGTSRLMTGETSWRPLSVDFVVPAANCPFQKIVLELPARVERETEIIGGVSYVDLQIQPK